MDIKAIKEAVEKTNCAINLKRQVVGVKFLFDQVEFNQAKAKPFTAKMPYCVMVKRAMLGKKIKAVFENFGCLSSARTLGLMEPDEMFSSGRHYRRLGLYRDLVVAKNTRQRMTLCRHKAYGVMIMPLEEFDDEPDVVLLVGTPYNAMRIVQAYTYMFGVHTAFKMSGNQALCSECTAYPFENNSINVSLLCAGTRFMAGWGDDELAIGFPFNKFLPIIDGLYATLNPTEPDRKKTAIESRLKEQHRNDLTIQYGKNYYTGLYLTQTGIKGKKDQSAHRD